MASLLQFVDSIAASPTVRLDLNDGSSWRMADGTEFPPPPIRRAMSQTLLTDGAVIPASAYDLRVVTLVLSLVTSSADDTAAAVQALHRELNRPTNILRWHPQNVTNAVFFRTFRTNAEAVLPHGQPDNRRKTITVHLDAEPFAYGPLETPVSAVTVSTDPAAVSNGCFVDVTGVKGDVESPAIIRWPESAVAILRQTLFATRRRGDPSAAPFWFQAEAMIQGTNTSTQPNDANFSGAGNNYSRCTFATSTTLGVPRLTVTDLGSPSVDLRGTYRVFLRYRKNTSSDAVGIQLQWGSADGNSIVNNDVFTTPTTTSICMADLGLMSIPFGIDPVYDTRTGVELPVDDEITMTVAAERTSGAGTLDFDFLLLVPADDRLGVVEFPRADAAADHRLLDAFDSSVHARTAAGEVVSVAAPSLTSGLPMLSPNQTNRIVILREVRAANLASLTTVSPVSVSYFPRYLSVRPTST